ncbi:hypothetical protein ACN47E_008910 [Coniothyrium glycines]
MSSRGQLQRQLSQILAEAKAQGFRWEEVIPEEVLAHFQDLEQLKTAQAYIKDIENRETQLNVQIAELTAKLTSKEAELEDQPEDYKAAKIDLVQAEKRIHFYKQLAEDGAQLADRHYRKLQDAAAKQCMIDEANRRIVKLQHHIEHLEASSVKQIEDNRKTIETYEQMHEHDMHLLADADAQLAQALADAKLIESESEQFSHTLETLLDDLESENAHNAAAVNGKSAQLRMTDELYAAVSAQVIPLFRCFERTAEAVEVYQHIFHMLADPRSTSVGTLPGSLAAITTDAATQLGIYHAIHAELELDGHEQDNVLFYLERMAATAASMLNNFDSVKDDVGGFLLRLRHEPKLWSTMKAKVGANGKFKRFSLG